MPVSCKLLNGVWRLVDPDGVIVHDAKHESEDSCKKQARAINANMELGITNEATIFQSIPDVGAFELTSESLVYEKELIYTDSFKKGETRFTIDDKMLRHWAETFRTWKDQGVEIPVPLEHTRDPEKRRGTVVDMSVKPNARGVSALFAKIKFRDAEAAKLASTADVSIYSPKEWEAAGKKWDRPIVHVALTDYPVVPGLGDFAIVASLAKEFDSMDPLKELAGELKLSLGEKDDPKTAIAAFVKSLVEKTTKLEGDLKLSQETLTKTADELKLSRSREAKKPTPVSKTHLGLLRDNRSMKLDKLVDDGRISKAVADKISGIFCSDAALTLALSDEETTDAFDLVIGALAENEVVHLRGQQSGPQVLKLSKEDIISTEKNPLLRDMAKRNKKA